jgi:hypothetical protein
MSDAYEALVSERAVRKILSEKLGTKVVKKRLVYTVADGQPRTHEYDLVANTKNGLLIGEVKASSFSSGARYPTKRARAFEACVYLQAIEAARKILVCTEREFFEHFKDDAKGLISDDIEIMLIEVE